MSTIGSSKSSSRSSASSAVKKSTPTASKAPTSSSKTSPVSKAPSDTARLSGEKAGSGKSPIDFSQSFGAKPAPKGDTLQRGAKGDQVKQLQTMLNAKGAQLETDGKFGPKTEKALKDFQQKAQIKSDGLAGPQTMGKLQDASPKTENPGKDSEAQAAQAAQAGAKPPESTQPGGTPTAAEPKVGTPLGPNRKSEALPQPKEGGPSGSHKAKGTGYFPENSAMEGGFKDRRGKDLQTLQDFMSGKSKYVSVAMDKNAKIPYGKGLHIPELDKKYADELKQMGKEHIDFRVVDTGGAFTNKGTGRIDIATANRKASLDPTINGPLTLDFQK